MIKLLPTPPKNDRQSKQNHQTEQNEYDRYLCSVCGAVDKRDYVNATGHDYQSVVIREADCDHEGKALEICRSCGEAKEIITPKGEHNYKAYAVSATCTSPGYTVKECSICEDRQITGITEVMGHSFAGPAALPAPDDAPAPSGGDESGAVPGAVCLPAGQ